MTGKTATRPITVSDKDHEVPVELMPGDEVPTWAEKHIKPEYMEEGMVAAGTRLYDDNVFQVVKAKADELGVEYGDDWDASQIAAAVRLKEHYNDAPVASFEDDDERDEAYTEAASAMDELFGTSNASGNVNAPDQSEKPAKSRSSSKSSGSSGGSES